MNKTFTLIFGEHLNDKLNNIDYEFSVSSTKLRFQQVAVNTTNIPDVNGV